MMNGSWMSDGYWWFRFGLWKASENEENNIIK